MLRAPEHLGRIAQDQRQRVGEQQLVELFLAVEMAKEEALDQPTERGDEQCAAERGEPEAPARDAQPLHQLERRVRAQHVERAVREVEHAQHAEDQRQPGRDQEQEHRGREAADALGEDKRWIGQRPNP